MSLPQVGTRWARIIIFTDFFRPGTLPSVCGITTSVSRRKSSRMQPRPGGGEGGGMGRYIVNNEWIEGEVEDNEDENDNKP